MEGAYLVHNSLLFETPLDYGDYHSFRLPYLFM